MKYNAVMAGKELRDNEKKKASSIVSDLTKKVEKDYSVDEIDKAEKKAEEKYSGKKALSQLWDKIQVLFFIAKHPKVWGLPVAVPAAVAVLYLVLPVDAIPDIIAGLGLVDDIFVITAAIGTIIKTVSSYSRERLIEIRALCPENLLPTFDDMFKFDAEALQKKEEEVSGDVIVETPLEAAVHGIEKTIAGTKKAVVNFQSDLEAKSEINPSIRNSKLYKFTSKASQFASAIPIAGEEIAYHALEVYLNIELLKKGIKSLISIILFALSLSIFSIGDNSIPSLVVSSILMLFSYTFFFVFVVKAIPRVYHFIRGYIKGGLEEAVVSVFFKKAEDDGTLKKELVRCGVKRIKNDRNLVAVLYKSFGKSLLSFLIKMMIIMVVVFVFKRYVLYSSGLDSTFQILFAPFVEIVHLIRAGE